MGGKQFTASGAAERFFAVSGTFFNNYGGGDLCRGHGGDRGVTFSCEKEAVVLPTGEFDVGGIDLPGGGGQVMLLRLTLGLMRPRRRRDFRGHVVLEAISASVFIFSSSLSNEFSLEI